MRTNWHDSAVAVGATDSYFVLTAILFVLRQLSAAGHKRVLPNDRFIVTRSWLHTKPSEADDGVPAKLLCPDKGHGRDPVAVHA